MINGDEAMRRLDTGCHRRSDGSGYISSVEEAK